MDSVVTGPQRPVVRLRRPSRRHMLAFLAVALVAGLAVVAAIREFAPRLADSTKPAKVVCGLLTADTTWDSNSTWVIESTCTGGVTVPAGVTLTIDASGGPVLFSTHGPGITISGGTLVTANTQTNAVTFDVQGDALSWPGLVFGPDGAGHQGKGTLTHSLIAHAQTGITVSGSSGTSSGYAVTLDNVTISNSFFDGIQVTDTPISVNGGTIGDAGNVGIDATLLASSTGAGVSITGVTFGRTGGEAIHESGGAQPVTITGNTINSAGTYGIHLEQSAGAIVQNNTISCSGHAYPLDCTTIKTRYPAIYLDGGSLDLNAGVTGNTGSRNGLDAIAMHGTTTRNLAWLTPSDSAVDVPSHVLGYVIDGSMTVQGATMTVPASGVVKTAGALTVNQGTLDASAGGSVFTSLDDNGPAGVTAACPSIFLASCPSPLGGREWSGISLVGRSGHAATAVVDSSTIAHASIGLAIDNSGIVFAASTYGLVVRNNSLVGPSASDGIAAIDTPVSIDHSTVTDSGAHGIAASFLGNPTTPAGLRIVNQTSVLRTGNEGILGTALSGQTVTIKDSRIDSAGAVGIRLEGAGQSGGSLVLQGNTIVGSGTGQPRSPAIYLNTVTADFSSSVNGNSGSGNGLDAIVFHGTALHALAWRTARINAASSDLLGYLLDGGLSMTASTLTVHPGDVVKAYSGGQITLNGGNLNAGDPATGQKVFTSLADNSIGVAACPSAVIVNCAGAGISDWGGINLQGGASASVTNGLIRFASTGVNISPGPFTAPALTLANTSIDSTSSDGVTAQSATVSVTGGTFSNIGQHGINAALSIAGTSLSVSGTHFSGTGNEAIFGTALGGHPVSITTTVTDRAGSFGINLQGADQLTLKDNIVTHSGFRAGGPYPAIYLNGVTGDFTTAISGNRGALNGLDALAFHGSVLTDLSWKTAAQSDTVQDLGYLLDGDLTLGAAKSLTVHAGDIVKVETGAIHLNGGTLLANDTSLPGTKVFTSLSDNSLGVRACPSALLTPCGQQALAGDWGGLILTEDSSHNRSSAVVVNAIIRYATTGIAISSGATSAPGSSSYGLVVERTRIGPTSSDGITSQDTPLLLSSSAITNAGGHGVAIDLLGASTSAGLQVRGVEIGNTGAEGILGSALTGHTVWISDSRIRNAGLYGIQLKDADRLVMRSNFICGSGAPAGAGVACAVGGVYPAAYLNGVTADMTRDVRGNVGALNGLDAIVLHGAVTDSLTWIDPVNGAGVHALGYLLDAGLVMNGGLTLRVHDATVKAFGGGITLNGGTLDASGATFTSLADTTAGLNLCPGTAPSPFIVCGKPPRAGDWGGITITNDENGHAGQATLVNSHVLFAATGITIDSGAPSGLQLQGTEIGTTSADGISARDTAVSVTDLGTQHSSIHNVGARGINASFTGTTAVGGLTVTNALFNQSGKEAILANVISGQAVSITGARITNAGTYGIHLIGARHPTVSGNILQTTGFTGASTGMHFPAIYLNGVVDADFNLAIAGNTGAANNLDAIAFHGTTATPLAWQNVTVRVALGGLGYIVDGPLTIGGDFTVPDQSLVRVVGGAITVNGNLVGGDPGTSRTFTSLLDPTTPVACPSPIIKLAGCSPAAGDWGGLVVNGAATLTNTTISFGDGLTVVGGPLRFNGGLLNRILGNAISLRNAPSSSITRVTFSNIGGKAVRSSGSSLLVTCSSIQSGGVSGDALVSVAESDFLNGTGMDGTGSTAINNWWGQAGGPGSQVTGTVTSSPYLMSQNPTLDPSLSFDPSVGITRTDNPTLAQPLDPINANVVAGFTTGNFGQGQLAGTFHFSRMMDTTISPAVLFNPGAHTLAPVGSGWTDDHTWKGVAAIDATTTNGTNTLQIAGATSCVPLDPQHPTANVVNPNPTLNTFPVDVTDLAHVAPAAVATGVTSATATLNGTLDVRGWQTDAAYLWGLTPSTLTNSTPVQHVAKATPAGAFTANLAGLSPVTTYYFQLVATSPNGTAVPSTVASFTTRAVTSIVAQSTTSTYSEQAISVPLQATVTNVSVPANPPNEGTVTFSIRDSGNALVGTTGTATPVNGLASATYTLPAGTSAGTYSIQAVFAPTTNFDGSDNSSQGSSHSLTVQQRATTAAAQSATATYGDPSVSLSALVTANVDSTGQTSTVNAGTVTFTVNGTSVTSTTIVSGSAAASLSLAGMGAGTYSLTAHYDGTANFTSSSDNTKTLTIGKATPTLTTTASGPVSVGQNITDTAHLAGPNLTGSLSFSVYAPGDTSCGLPLTPAPAGATVSGSGDYTSGTFTTSLLGSYRWIAGYSGDANNNAISTSCGDANESSMVTKASPSLATTPSAGVALGGSISDQASVSGGFAPGDAPASVTFTLYGPFATSGMITSTSCTASILTSAVSIPSATTATSATYQSASFTTSALGVYQWVASYSGNANNNAAGPTVCGDTTEQVTVTKAIPTLTSTASGPVTVAASINDVAQLAGGFGTLGGSISFSVFGPGDLACATPLTPAPTGATVAGAGNYPSGSFTPAAAGTYRWKASYSGDANNSAVSTECGDAGESSTVNKSSPTLATTPSAGLVVGGGISDQASVSGGFSPGDVPASVTFTLYGPFASSVSITGSSCTTSAFSATATTPSATTSTAAAYQSGTFTTAAAGVYQWVASYSGNGNNNAAGPTACGDATEQVTVTKATPTLTSTASGPAIIGGSINDVAHLAGGFATLGGSMSFSVYAPSDTTCSSPLTPAPAGATVLGSGDYTSGNFSTTLLGSYGWIASYSGDANNNAVSTSCGAAGESSSVTKASPSLATTPSPGVPVPGSISDQASVSGGFAPGDAPATVTFSLYGPFLTSGSITTSSCTTSILTSTASSPTSTTATSANYQSASFTTAAAGVYQWVASYSGNGNNNAAGPTACGDTSEQVTVTP